MVIYKICNKINNKIYIGKTQNDSDRYLGSGILIKRAIHKYGSENFVKTIIDYGKSIEELNYKEKFWIKYFNSTNSCIGYNISDGGDGGDLFSNNPNKEIIRKKYRRFGDKNGMFGKKHSPQSKHKMSINKKGQRAGIPTWNKGISIKKYSLKYIKCFSNRSGEYIVCGKYELFCIENNLDLYSSRHFIDKGKIPSPKKGKPSIKRMNLVGWEIKRVSL